MLNHPYVECRNNEQGYVFTLKINSPYRDILKRKLHLLEAWASQHTLESATALINDTLREQEDYPYSAATPNEVNKVVFGDRGLITSVKQSLSPRGNRHNPYKGSRLTRRQGSPFFHDQEGNYFLRGEVVMGSYPVTSPTSKLSAIRRCIELNLNLPTYIRHEVKRNDETVCRDEKGRPV